MRCRGLKGEGRFISDFCAYLLCERRVFGRRQKLGSSGDCKCRARKARPGLSIGPAWQTMHHMGSPQHHACLSRSNCSVLAPFAAESRTCLLKLLENVPPTLTILRHNNSKSWHLTQSVCQNKHQDTNTEPSPCIRYQALREELVAARFGFTGGLAGGHGPDILGKECGSEAEDKRNRVGALPLV